MEMLLWLSLIYPKILVVFFHIQIVLVGLFIFYRKYPVEKSHIEQLCYMSVISEDLHNGWQWLKQHKISVLIVYSILLSIGFAGIYFLITQGISFIAIINHSVIEGSWWFVLSWFWLFISSVFALLIQPYFAKFVFIKNLPETDVGYQLLVTYIEKGLHPKLHKKGTKFQDTYWGLKSNVYWRDNGIDEPLNFAYIHVHHVNIRNKIMPLFSMSIIWALTVYLFLQLFGV